MESTDTLTRARVTDLADLADGALLSEATEIEALAPGGRGPQAAHRLPVGDRPPGARRVRDAVGSGAPVRADCARDPGRSGHARRRRVHARAAGGGARVLARVGVRRSSPTRSTCTTGSRCCGTRPGPSSCRRGRRDASPPAPGTCPFDAARWVDRQARRACVVASSARCPRPCRRRGRRTLRRGGPADREAARAAVVGRGAGPPRPAPLHRHVRAARQRRHPRPDALPRRRLRGGRGPRRARRHRRPRRPQGQGARGDRRRPGAPRPDDARPRLATPQAHEQARRHALGRRDAKVRLYLHASLADVVAGDSRATGSAEGLGPVTLDLVRDWAGRSRVTIQPVLHVAADDRWSVDRHDPPPRMADEVRAPGRVMRLPVVRSSRTPVRPRPPRALRGPGRRRSAGSDVARVARAAVPAAPPGEDLGVVVLRACRSRHLPLDRSRRTLRPRHAARHGRRPAELGVAS